MTDAAVKKIRSMFPDLNKLAYFMHGFMAPLPKPVFKMFQDMADLSPSNFVSEKFLKGLMSLSESRQLFATLIGASACEIAVTHNTSEGVNIAAELIDIPRGANVIVSEMEHPCSTYPWILRKEKDVELRYVAVRNNKVFIEDITQQVDKNTKVTLTLHKIFTFYFELS